MGITRGQQTMNKLDYQNDGYRVIADIALERLGVPRYVTNELGQTIDRVDALQDVWNHIGSWVDDVSNEAESIGDDLGYERGESEGYERGESEGYDSGYTEGYEAGLAEGIKSVAV